jgi:hypothetical protein
MASVTLSHLFSGLCMDVCLGAEVMEIKTRVLHVLSRHVTTELHPQTLLVFF